MSKSRGNTVSIDEAAHRVFSVLAGYEFRTAAGRLVDWDAECVWRDPVSGAFFTGAPTREPCFLKETR